MASTTNGLDNTWLEQLPFQDYYIYSPLQANSFRLFELYPGEGWDTVRGRLVHTNLDLAPQYEAISYHWGDRSRRSVEVDGFMLHTTWSTETALQQVRKRDEVRYVWIDAVCINQEDLLERGHQVKIMAKFYSGADQVLICINDPATRELRYSLEAIHAAFEPVHRICGYPNPSRRFFDKAQVGLTRQAICTGIRNVGIFLQNPWFSRVWVLQEVGLSRRAHLFCNDWSVSFEKVIFAICFLHFQRKRVKTDRSMETSLISALVKWFWRPGNIKDFWEVLHHTSHYKASEPRDKIFALLGHPSALTSNGSEMLVQPDYQNSVGQLYYEFTRSMMRGPLPLRVLSSVFHPETCPDRELSWIPRWNNIRNRLFAHDVSFDCSVGNSADFEIQDDQKILKVRGVLFNTITYVSRVMTKKRANLSKDIQEIWTELEEESCCPIPESGWKAYLQTLTANNYYWKRGASSSLVPNDDIEGSFRQVLSSFEEQGLEPSFKKAMESTLDDISVENKAVLYYVEQVMRAAMSRRFTRSRRGFYGLVPAAAKQYDVICILFGATVPFVLRSDGASGAWRLVGECYLHGIMHGEGIEMLREGLLEEQIFHILG